MLVTPQKTSLGDVIGFLRFHSVHTHSRKSIEAWQKQKLLSLISRLEKNIPLFRELCAAHGVRPEHIKTLSDLSRLPVISKDVFIGHAVEKFTNGSGPLEGLWVKTAGTSGTPFSALRRKNVLTPLYRDSLHHRFLIWEKPWRLTTNNVRIVSIRADARNSKNHLHIAQKGFLKNREKTLSQIAAFRPDVIETYPSTLHLLARTAEELGVPVRTQFAVSDGEPLSPALRRFIEQRLGCSVFDRYDLEECGTVGMECKTHDGLHVNVESFIIEIVDDAGNPLPEGSSGTILITDLHNYNMPLIRYNTGDRGHLSWEPCSCGLDAARIWVEGQHAVYLELLGRRYRHAEFSAALKPFGDKLLRYQIAKQSSDRIVVRIIPDPEFTNNTLTAIRDTVSAALQRGISVSAECVADLPVSGPGKTPLLIEEDTRR